MAYVIAGRKGGTVRFVPSEGTITKEQEQMTSKVTSYPVEIGANINDHVIKDPEKFQISGEIVGGDAAKEALKSMFEARDIISYTGKSRISDLVITSLSFDNSSKNRYGSSFKASFQKILLASAVYVETGEVPLMSQQDEGKGSAKSTKNTGTTTPGISHITGSEYANYVNSYGSKAPPSTAPNDRATPSTTGITKY